MRQNPGKSVRSLFIAALATTCFFGTANATPFFGYDVLFTGNFVDSRQTNTAGIGVGIFDSFSVDLTPTSGTTVVATQGTASRDVPFLESPALPFEFFRAITLSASLTGPWNLNITNPAVNGGTTAVLPTRPLFTSTPPPFVTDVRLTGGGLTPTISWVRPPGFTPSNQTIFIFDKSDRTTRGSSTLIRTDSIGATTNSFIIPGGVLASGKQYTFAVQLDQRNPTTVALSSTLTGRSRSFVDFTTLPPSFTGSVVLPVIGVDADPTDSFGAPFIFDVGVSAGVPIVIDPTIATGYEYRVGAGDPLFASVALPDIGDPSFDLYLWNGSAYVLNRSLSPGARFFFATGIDRFEIRGIDPALALDPTNPLGFMTELTFVGSGRFTGTQTPIIASFVPAAVMEPGSIALLGIGLAAFGITRRRKKA